MRFPGFQLQLDPEQHAISTPKPDLDAAVAHCAEACAVEVTEVIVQPSSEPKCARCWHYRPDVNAEGLCGRCEGNLQGPGEPRRHA